jgi:hypothetical protein
MTLRIWTTKRRMANHGQATVVKCEPRVLYGGAHGLSYFVFVIELVQSFLSLALVPSGLKDAQIGYYFPRYALCHYLCHRNAELGNNPVFDAHN